MKLHIRNNRLGLGDAFKLVSIAWFVGMGAVFGSVFLLILIMAIIGGGTMVNGEVVDGRGAVLIQMVPMLLFLPVVIGIQAAMFGGIMVVGLLIYRQFKPIEVISIVERDAASPISGSSE